MNVALVQRVKVGWVIELSAGCDGAMLQFDVLTQAFMFQLSHHAP